MSIREELKSLENYLDLAQYLNILRALSLLYSKITKIKGRHQAYGLWVVFMRQQQQHLLWQRLMKLMWLLIQKISTLKQQDLVEKGIFSSYEDVEKLLQALSKEEEEAVRA
ncbi:hypothetical protein ACJX0J_021538, partial [Zea mays]